jgi:hypothetical protein
MDLLREWASWKRDTPPFVLKRDRAVFDSAGDGRTSVTIPSWREAYSASDFCAPKDHRLHLGLLPQPFLGDLRRASIYILLLNPGLGPHDYYGEHKVPEFREALRANLKQRFRRGSVPFVFLDPQFSWHGGFGWWHGKLAGVISRLAAMWEIPFATARFRLARELASIELVPYHSSSFRSASGWIHRLESVSLARAFVHDVVVPRVRRGKAIIIVTRQVRAWDLPNHHGIVRYSAQEARAAHLSPGSQGGMAILRHLARRHKCHSADAFK